MPLKIKDAGLRLRVERDLRHDFIETCRSEGKAAAQVLRDYMRDYVARNRSAAQQELALFAIGQAEQEIQHAGKLRGRVPAGGNY